MIEDILKALAKGNVKLSYTSLKSGKLKEVTGTLQGDKFITQHATSNKIIFWDTENDRWEDIECNTIKTYKTMEND